MVLEEVTADCPWTYGEDGFCDDSDKIKPAFGMTPVYFSLCSCIASMIGSILMIIPFVMWKDVRSGLRTIVTYLAVADFFTAFGYTIASFNYIVYQNNKNNDYVDACNDFSIVCQIQAYISSWASLSSFWWTAILAFYLYSTITKGNANILNKYFPAFHVFVWGSPILVMLPLLITGSLGYSLFSAGGWCFISSERKLGDFQYEDYDLSFVTIIKILAGGKAVEIATYIWVFVLYGMMYCTLKRKVEHNYNNSFSYRLLFLQKRLVEKEERSEGFLNLLKTMEKKLYAIPVAFILVRMWGTLQFVFSIIVFACPGAVDGTGCVSYPVYVVFYFLACIQVSNYHKKSIYFQLL